MQKKEFYEILYGRKRRTQPFQVYEDSPGSEGPSCPCPDSQHSNASSGSNASVAQEDEVYVISPHSNRTSRARSPSPHRTSRTRSPSPQSNRTSRSNEGNGGYSNTSEHQNFIKNAEWHRCGKAGFSSTPLNRNQLQREVNRGTSTPNDGNDWHRDSTKVTSTPNDGNDWHRDGTKVSSTPNTQKQKSFSVTRSDAEGSTTFSFKAKSVQENISAGNQESSDVHERVQRLTVAEASRLLPAALAEHVVELLTQALQSDAGSRNRSRSHSNRSGSRSENVGTADGVVAIPLNLPALMRSQSDTNETASGEYLSFSGDESEGSTQPESESPEEAEEEEAAAPPVLLLFPAPPLNSPAFKRLVTNAFPNGRPPRRAYKPQHGPTRNPTTDAALTRLATRLESALDKIDFGPSLWK